MTQSSGTSVVKWCQAWSLTVQVSHPAEVRTLSRDQNWSMDTLERAQPSYVESRQKQIYSVIHIHYLWKICANNSWWNDVRAWSLTVQVSHPSEARTLKAHITYIAGTAGRLKEVGICAWKSSLNFSGITMVASYGKNIEKQEAAPLKLNADAA